MCKRRIETAIFEKLVINRTSRARWMQRRISIFRFQRQSLKFCSYIVVHQKVVTPSTFSQQETLTGVS